MMQTLVLILSCLFVAMSFMALPTAALAASAAAHFQMAVKFRFAGETDAAISEYKQGLEIDPNSVDGHAQLGQLLLEERGDVDGAISEFMTALTIDPACRFCDLRMNEALDLKNSKAADQIARGNMLYGAGEINRAAAAYRIAVQIDPADATAHNSLAWTLYRQGHLEEGMHEVKEALRLKPDDAEFVNTLACLLFDLGDLDGAMSQWRKAIALSKTPNPADLYGLAIGLLLKGDTVSACRYFKESVKIDPKYKEAEYLRDRIGMSAKALSTHEQLLSLLPP